MNVFLFEILNIVSKGFQNFRFPTDDFDKFVYHWLQDINGGNKNFEQHNLNNFIFKFHNSWQSLRKNSHYQLDTSTYNTSPFIAVRLMREKTNKIFVRIFIFTDKIQFMSINNNNNNNNYNNMRYVMELKSKFCHQPDQLCFTTRSVKKEHQKKKTKWYETHENALKVLEHDGMNAIVSKLWLICNIVADLLTPSILILKRWPLLVSKKTPKKKK